ncbi:MAG: OmpA/MotB [Betaproteobacteria bacterium]|nr:OmpA/MotB [Betaproteobacteria bacterium]
MHQKTIISLCCATASFCFGAVAVAADTANGWYAGGNVGQSRAKVDGAGINAAVLATGTVATAATSTNENDTGFKLFAGYRFHPNFAVEGGYFNLGKFGFTTVTTGPAATLNGTAKSENGFNLDLVGILPLNESFSLLARVGAQTSKTTLSLGGVGPGGTTSISSSQTSGSYKAGLGAQYDFTKSIGARAEWERYRVPGGASGSSKADVDLFSLGVVVKF